MNENMNMYMEAYTKEIMSYEDAIEYVYTCIDEYDFEMYLNEHYTAGQIWYNTKTEHDREEFYCEILEEIARIAFEEMFTEVEE